MRRSWHASLSREFELFGEFRVDAIDLFLGAVVRETVARAQQVDKVVADVVVGVHRLGVQQSPLTLNFTTK